jgi:hypothetical protein
MLPPSATQRRVVRMWTDVLQKRITSFVRVEYQQSKKPACSRRLGISSTMKMEVIRSFETSVCIGTKRGYFPKFVRSSSKSGSTYCWVSYYCNEGPPSRASCNATWRGARWPQTGSRTPIHFLSLIPSKFNMWMGTTHITFNVLYLQDVPFIKIKPCKVWNTS